MLIHKHMGSHRPLANSEGYGTTPVNSMEVPNYV